MTVLPSDQPPVSPTQPAVPVVPVTRETVPRSNVNKIEGYIVKALGAASAVIGALETSGVITGKYGEILFVVGGALIALERYIDGTVL